ncbi:MAG TPA: hypothetical protein VGD16_10530, partial [Enterovirga sp.]
NCRRRCFEGGVPASRRLGARLGLRCRRRVGRLLSQQLIGALASLQLGGPGVLMLRRRVRPIGDTVG